MNLGDGELEPGTMVGGRYAIVRLLGRGGMGDVYLARHEQLGKEVAVKVLQPQFAEDEEVVRRFLREARAAAAIGHPGIVEVFDLGLDESSVFLVMEKLEGEELYDRIASSHPLPIPFVARVISDVAEAVQAAHEKGIIHRDLKPQNIFLAHRGRQRDVAKLLDFGIAKLVEGERADAPLTRTGQVFGTPLYMSPEQLRGTKDVDARADVYALGAILYQCLAGQAPFEAQSYPELLLKIINDEPTPLRELRPDVPQALADLVAEAMAKEKEERVPSASALVERLASFDVDRPTEEDVAPARLRARPSSEALAPTVPSDFPAPASDAEPLGGARRVGVTAALVIALIAAVVVGVWLTRPDPGEPATSEPVSERPSPTVGSAPEPAPAPAQESAPSEPVTRLVRFRSEPSGATVSVNDSVNDAVLCTTPCSAELRHADVDLRVERAGYLPAVRSLAVPFPDQVEVALRPREPDRQRRGSARMRPPNMADDEPPPLKTR